MYEEDIKEEDLFFPEYTKFTIEAKKDGQTLRQTASSLLEAEKIMDAIIEYGDRKDVVMVLRQNDRLIRGYIRGQVVYPTQYQGKIDVNKRKVA